MLREDCFAFWKERHECTALKFLYCEKNETCTFYKPRHKVPLRGRGKTCAYCGLPFVPPKYSKDSVKYCSDQCREKARYERKKEMWQKARTE